jgi:hypothetical protein
MFRITLQGTDRLDIKMSGKLDAAGMKAALDELTAKSRNIRHGMMLYDVVDFHLPTIEAIAIEFSRFPTMFGFLGKFDRAAVLTDKRWLMMISELEGALIPGLEIRAFGREQRAEAEEWLSGKRSS